MLWRILFRDSTTGYVETGTGFLYTDVGVRLLGRFDYRTTDTAPVQPGWYVPTPPPPAIVRVLRPIISKLAFRLRFTSNERQGLELAMIDNVADLQAARNRAAALRAFNVDLQTAPFVALNRADIIASVNQMETASLIGAGRAAVILSQTIGDDERP